MEGLAALEEAVRAEDGKRLRCDGSGVLSGMFDVNGSGFTSDEEANRMLESVVRRRGRDSAPAPPWWASAMASVDVRGEGGCRGGGGSLDSAMVDVDVMAMACVGGGRCLGLIKIREPG